MEFKEHTFYFLQDDPDTLLTAERLEQTQEKEVTEEKEKVCLSDYNITGRETRYV